MFSLFQKLYGYVAVCFYLGCREIVFPAKFPVVVEYAVVCESKLFCAAGTPEWVVVAVTTLAALGGHSGVPCDCCCALREKESDLVGWLGLFVGDDFSLSDVGDSGCVCASFLCGYGEIFNEALRMLLLIIPL